MNKEDVVDFLFEMGMLKRVSREGWKLIGIRTPESVSEHSLRAAQIGYILAIMEGYDNPEQICCMLVFHDIGESRIGDLHKVANRYTTADEKQVVNDQLRHLDEIGENIFSLWQQVETQENIAGKIAKDADLLELAVTACEYKQNGYHGSTDWLEKTTKRMQTTSGKQLLEALVQGDPNHWWQGLKKI